MMDTGSTNAAAISRTWLIGFRVWVTLRVLFDAMTFSLGLGLGGPAWDAGGVAIHRVHHVGIALFSGIVVVGLLAQVRAPDGNVTAFRQVAIGILALEITALILGDPDNHGNNVSIFEEVFLVFTVPVIMLAALHPARHRMLRLGRQISPVLTGITLLKAVPLSDYGVSQALLQRNSWPPAADPHHNGHWMAMAMLAFAIPLVGLLASLRTEGWQVPAGVRALPRWGSGWCRRFTPILHRA